ncbi:MAG: ATP-binding cassette domain-containing protein, partial [Armatimonadetes bacterium]|nr:ATP-binding cassette domain-containing protein [Armatimonadota bacterium]
NGKEVTCYLSPIRALPLVAARLVNPAVTVNGQTLAGLTDDGLTLYRRNAVGFVFQAAHLVPALTVMENVMLPLIPVGLAEAEKEQRVLAALEQVNIAHRADHLPGELSGGEQQRTAVARAIVNQPSLILADEPTGELDADNAARIMEILTSFTDQGRTVIIASHDADVIGVMDRVLRLENGMLVDGD